ncbi:cell wall-binding repeat-containing protein [Ornithinibacillus salinisoli]|uniref:Cell wall-binding repeat-containing protein n=1 Tax=Ornithinibacillus salinisoli TaxID=1848459 RepID=A0ABW4VZ61_9BACI
MVKKSFAIVMALLLVLSNITMVSAAPQKVDPLNRSKEVQTRDKITKEELDELYDVKDKVRVIVEVEGEPAITYATQQGKKFSELSEGKKEELHSDALESQGKVQNLLKSEKVDLVLKENFTTVFNGFSGEVEYGKVAKIEKLDGVKRVTISNEYERPEVTPDMKYSKELVEAQRTWDEYGYDGEGMIVGVIDTGVDPSHRDFVLTNEEEAALTEGSVESLASENGLPGQYYTAKVPYGYNYMDGNSEIRDLGPGASMHGMHVSGTVGANGDEENGGLKGVAPEAQILALKVFGNDPEMGSTWGDIYIKAIDDAILLGVDVLNMSLGSTAAFVSPEDPEQQAVARAVENGVLMSISAGNSAHLGNGFYNPYASNPDVGVVGAPSLSHDSISVASIENTYMDMDALKFSYGEEEGLFTYMSASDVHPNDVGGTYEIEFVGIGDAEGFGDKDLTGKFAFALRGNAFTDTAFNAMAANAAGVIVYNHSDGWVNMASDPAINIPQLFMQKTDGEELKAALDAGETVSISFEGDVVTAANPLADTMSDFTSWGVTPNLDFKPEITAPGGNILSTFNDDQYGSMSGTSMAAPHVAGGSALVLQRVDDQFELEGKDRVQMAKNILMNTAEPVMDKGTINEMFGTENPYSPRRQGAGIMQLHKAISTPVVVTEANSGEAKVALKEVNDQISFTLEATNYSDEAVTYDVAANVQTDLALFGVMGYAADELEAQELAGANVTINGGDSTVTIPVNGTVSLDVEIDLSEATVYSEDAGTDVDPDTIFENGYFVEGYVTLSNEAQPELSVPYVGFNGDWNEAPVIDELAYDESVTADGEFLSFYEQGAMLFEGEDGYYYLGHDPFSEGAYGRSINKIAISPNGDGVQDEAIPLLSFLRNAKLVEYNVLDEDKNPLRTIKTDTNVRKNYYDGGLGSPYYLNPDFEWDGTVKNQVVEDGQYFYEVSTTIDFPGAEAQSFQVPVLVDTVAPVLESASVDGDELAFSVSDELSGVSYVEVFVEGESLGVLPADIGSVSFGEELPAGTDVSLVAVDNAGNSTEVVLSGVNDGAVPVISVTTPETFSVFDTNEVVVAGTVSDDTGIIDFKVEGEAVELVSEGNGVYSFETTVTFEDGANPIHLYAKDEAGNETTLSNSRLIFVDTTAPELEVEATETVAQDVTSVDLVASVSDNAEELRLIVDGNEVFYNEMSGYDMVPFSTEVTTEVDLEPGNNVFEFELTDLAGNVTTKEVSIYRDPVARLSGENRYETSVQVSEQGWESSDVVVLARGDDYADALAGAPLAKKHDAPLLLTKPGELTDVTEAEIERLGAETVYILGGEDAVSSDVADALEAKDITVERIEGSNRYETAVAIANEVVEGEINEAVLVNGSNFPDALSVASYAASSGLPILLVKEDAIPEATETALDTLNVEQTLVVGGTAVISDDVFNNVPNADRVFGDNRYETAVEVAKHFNVDSNKYFVATGANYADALSTAALAAKEGTGILLVKNSVSSHVENFIAENAVELVTVTGGLSAVSDDVVAELKQLLD